MLANTIQKDLKKITEESRKVERDLRTERIKLIRAKVEESGGDVKALSDAGIHFELLSEKIIGVTIFQFFLF